jgi:hypothetical protein
LGTLDKESDLNADQGVVPLDHRAGSSPGPVACYDAKGHLRPITREQQAQKARAVAAFVEKMLAMPDEDPPGAWEEAMRDLDAHRPHRKRFEGLSESWRG